MPAGFGAAFESFRSCLTSDLRDDTAGGTRFLAKFGRCAMSQGNQPGEAYQNFQKDLLVFLACSSIALPTDVSYSP